jgi:hypothetical protein
MFWAIEQRWLEGKLDKRKQKGWDAAAITLAMRAEFRIGCVWHPSYRGAMPPRAMHCERCSLLWDLLRCVQRERWSEARRLLKRAARHRSESVEAMERDSEQGRKDAEFD